MISTASYPVLAQRLGMTSTFRQAILVVIGIAALAVAAKIRIEMWPVPITMGTFAVLTIGAAFGMRLGLITILGYLMIGALGADVFSGTGETRGLAYMMGGTGGYLFGFVLATGVLGALAARGWDRSPLWMGLALVLGNAVIYVPGLLWLGATLGWDKPILDWGFWPFLLGDALKLMLAALLLPGLWQLLQKR